MRRIIKKIKFHKVSSLILFLFFMINSIIMTLFFNMYISQIVSLKDRYDSLGPNYLYIESIASQSKLNDYLSLTDSFCRYKSENIYYLENNFKLLHVDENFEQYGLPYKDHTYSTITTINSYSENGVIIDSLAFSRINNDRNYLFNISGTEYKISKVIEIEYPNESDFFNSKTAEKIPTIILESDMRLFDYEYAVADASNLETDVSKINQYASFIKTGADIKTEFYNKYIGVFCLISIISILPILFALFSVINMYDFIIYDEKNDIGISKIFGIKKRRMQMELTFECIILSISGCIVGILPSGLISFLLFDYFISPFFVVFIIFSFVLLSFIFGFVMGGKYYKMNFGELVSR